MASKWKWDRPIDKEWEFPLGINGLTSPREYDQEM